MQDELIIILETNNKVSVINMRKGSREKHKVGVECNISVFLLNISKRQKEQSLSVMKLSLDNLDKVSPQDDAFGGWGGGF